MTDPQIIRTTEELEALDPDTLLMNTDLVDPLTLVWYWLDGGGNPARGSEADLPAVVVATGDQVREAQQALGEANKEPATDSFHNSIGLWQQQPSTWEEE